MFRALLVASCLPLTVAGCVIIPIPAEETVVSGRAFTDDEVRMISGAESPLDVMARFGRPLVDFGPQRVFVYFWRVNKGSVAWAIVGSGYGGAAAGVLPWEASRLLIVAFDPAGKVLKAETAKISSLSVSEQVRSWLSSNGLAAQVVGPRPEEPAHSGHILFVYHPSISTFSTCSASRFDSLRYKSVAVDGQIVGDLTKGKYLAAQIEPGDHKIGIYPKQYFEAWLGAPITLNIRAEPNQATYIEADVCSAGLLTDEHIIAAVRDPAVALQAMRSLQPAW